MKRLLFIILLVGLISCETGNVDPAVVDFGKFTMEMPKTWTTTIQQGYDSFVGQIETDDNQIITFDLGWYSDRLNVDPNTHDIDVVIIDNKRAKSVKPKNLDPGTTGIYFDSLETTKINKFQISGINLNSSNQKLLMRAAKSLEFKD
ncbi:MAG: hypothetical protein KF803_04230 [Cyclobacteriaceae bacterium]|nr:hypothetical protein [Cyclobacteriaceae bacterium]